MADLDTLIDITTRITSGAVPRLRFGRGLLISVTSDLPASGSGKARLFSDHAAVLSYFGAGDVADDAAVWFAAEPPPQGLYVGRWAETDAATVLRGGTPGALSDLDAANSTFTINGQDVTVDLSAAATYAAVAAAIQTEIVALGGIFAGATVAHDGTRFTLTLAGSDVIADGALGDTAATTDTDIADALGLAAGSAGRRYLPGASAETAAEAAAAMVQAALPDAPVGVVLGTDAPLTSGGVDTRTAVSIWAETADVVFALRDTAAAVVESTDTTSHAQAALAASRGQTAVAYEGESARPDIGLIAAMSAQRLDQPASVISPHAKTIPNVLPSIVPAGAGAVLDAKRVNRVATVFGESALLGGFTSREGYWLDAVWFTLWLRNRIQAGVWASLRGSRRFTTGLLTDALLDAFQAGVRNGGIQSGRKVSNAIRAEITNTTGNPDFDGILTTGYLVHVQPLTDADRTARIARFNAWATGAEAVHRIVGDVTFQN